MEITIETIEHVASLARLSLKEDEKIRLTSDLKNIISYVEKLNELDTSNIKPMEHVIPMKNVLREDIVNASYDRNEILKNAHESGEGGFKVPKVVE